MLIVFQLISMATIILDIRKGGETMEREFKIKVNSSYESYANCMNSNDTDEICKMRGCIHALTENDIKD